MTTICVDVMGADKEPAVLLEGVASARLPMTQTSRCWLPARPTSSSRSAPRTTALAHS